MNTDTQIRKLRTTLVAAAVASALVACVSAPVKPSGAVEARSRLTQLQSDPSLATRAPLAMQAADSAVRAAEQPESDNDLATYRVYIADRKVDIARAQAETQRAEEERSTLSAQADKARLDARTRELSVARDQAATARSATDVANAAAADSARSAADARGAADTANLAAAASQQQVLQARVDTNAANAAAATANQQASTARADADAANLAAANSKQQASELQEQIELLQARVTDRGLVVTLGDVLFASGGDNLKQGPSGNLNKLVVFLDKYPARTATIEGYTDSTGSESYNQALSERRADSVMAYLVNHGVGSGRLTASGKGEGSPVADNDSASGRQQNRRVEVIIDGPATLPQIATGTQSKQY